MISREIEGIHGPNRGDPGSRANNHVAVCFLSLLVLERPPGVEE
jgi:hypothetical protein